MNEKILEDFDKSRLGDFDKSNLGDFGKTNHFKVPEGYFDQLASNVMSKIATDMTAKEADRTAKEADRTAKVVTLRKALLVAASVVAAVVMGISYYFHTNSAEQQLADVYDSEYIDDAADYVMLDNSEIYACLEDN